jgi:hypothetical protein
MYTVYEVRWSNRTADGQGGQTTHLDLDEARRVARNAKGDGFPLVIIVGMECNDDGQVLKTFDVA